MFGKSGKILTLNDTENPKFASRYQIASGLCGPLYNRQFHQAAQQNRFVNCNLSSAEDLLQLVETICTCAKIDQVDATLFVEQRLNNVVIKVQQHLLN